MNLAITRETQYHSNVRHGSFWRHQSFWGKFLCLFAHFRQYLWQYITTVGFQLIQRRIVRVNTIFHIAHKKKSKRVKLQQLANQLTSLKIEVTRFLADKLDWRKCCGLQLRIVRATCLPNNNIKFISKNNQITCVYIA